MGGKANSNQFFSLDNSIYSNSFMLAGKPFPNFIFNKVSDITSGFFCPLIIGSGEYGLVYASSSLYFV